MNALLKAFVIVGILFFSAGLGASEERPSRKTQKVDFDGSEVDGQARTPDGAYLMQRRGVRFSPLYNVRDQFDEEIKASVDYLK
jgi:hypothetical protein